jgi:hypothetical protein
MAIRHYCTFEDRPDALTGVKLLARSLQRHCADFRLWVAMRTVPPAFQTWVDLNAESVRLLPLKPKGDTWNIKAEVIAHCLGSLADEIVWLDSDILVLRNLEELWSRSGQELVVAQEFDLASKITADQIHSFGLNPVIALPHAVNSCVLRFRQSHRFLLTQWDRLLSSDAYRAEQRLPFKQRRRGLRSDQDVLEYVLSTAPCGRQAEVSYVRTGLDIIQDHGSTTYDLTHRLCNASGIGRPYFVHALGQKPWDSSYRRQDSAYVESARLFPSDWNVAMRNNIKGTFLYKIAPRLTAHLRGAPRCAAGKFWRLVSTGSMQRKPE